MDKLNLKQISELSFEEILQFVESGVIAQPRIIRVDLTNALSNSLYNISGNLFYIINSSNADANLTVRFNRQDSDGIYHEKSLGMRTPFKRFFLTCSAQSGYWVDIMVGTLSPELLDILDNRSATTMTTILQNILNELQGITTAGTFGSDVTVGTSAVSILASNTSRKCFCIFADYANADKIYVGFDDTVTTSKKIATLSPGQSMIVDDYRGTIQGISGTAGQKVSASEW